jgi:radical SAM superfamily enzyme YgiQ (UPF0313 family)
MSNVVIINVPPVDYRGPAIGPALLKANLEKHGISCYVADMNAEIVENNVDYDIDNHMSSILHQLKAPSKGLEMINAWEDYYHDCLEFWMVKWLKEMLATHQPRVLGLSVHHYQCVPYCIRICQIAKQIGYTGKVILGGAWVKLYSNTVGFLLKEKLIHSVVAGEGEDIIVKYVRGEEDPVYNKYYQVEDYVDLPHPDYSDSEMDLYQRNWLFYIEGSRSCVRKCSFCDVPVVKGKFRIKPGREVANEMIDIQRRYGVDQFRFSDSLLNGSMPQMRELLETLGDHNDANPDKKIYFNSYLIVRPESIMPKSDFDLIKRAGGIMMSLGVESGNEKVRETMYKKFTNAELEYCFEQIIERQMKIQIQLICGFPTETEEDFEDTMELLRKYSYLAHQNYTLDNGLEIAAIELSIHWNARLQKDSSHMSLNQEEYGIIKSKTSDLWHSENVNPRSSFERYKRICKLADEAGYRRTNKRDNSIVEKLVKMWERGQEMEVTNDNAAF